VISRLRGVPAGRTADGLVLDVGGVGYLVAATPSVLRRAEGVQRSGPEAGEEVTVETYLHVREDALQLYGFADGAERELFVHLLGVSGIGPKVALGVVSSAPAGELRRAIVLEDPARFQAIPGIGKKTAERIVLELKEKLGSEDVVALPSLPGAPTTPHVVARNALVELGYSVIEAEQALARVDPELSPEERVREALRSAA
jgi:Holliday junction DNA helicase RuvA